MTSVDTGTETKDYVWYSPHSCFFCFFLFSLFFFSAFSSSSSFFSYYFSSPSLSSSSFSFLFIFVKVNKNCYWEIQTPVITSRITCMASPNVAWQSPRIQLYWTNENDLITTARNKTLFKHEKKNYIWKSSPIKNESSYRMHEKFMTC